MKLVRDFIKSSGAPIDQNRVYVTGLSMGGFATWNLISKYPHFFAAAIPICGGYDVSSIPYPLKIDNPQSFQLNEIVAAKHLPIWTFHGDKDTVVPISQTERLVKRLRRSGTTRLIFTIYKDTTHNSWERSYDNWLLYNWLFSQVRKP
jgi:predicted peptidase